MSPDQSARDAEAYDRSHPPAKDYRPVWLYTSRHEFPEDFE